MAMKELVSFIYPKKLWPFKVRYPDVRRWFLVRQVPLIRNWQKLPCMLLCAIDDKLNMQAIFLLAGLVNLPENKNFYSQTFPPKSFGHQGQELFQKDLVNVFLPRDLLPAAVFWHAREHLSRPPSIRYHHRHKSRKKEHGKNATDVLVLGQFNFSAWKMDFIPFRGHQHFTVDKAQIRLLGAKIRVLCCLRRPSKLGFSPFFYL